MAVERQTTDNKNRAAARRMLAAEVGLAAVIALLMIPTLGLVAARSAVLGGLIFVVPNALFALCAFRDGASRTPAAAMRAVYTGEAVKLLATLILFAACFMLVKPLHIGALLGVFGLLVVVHAAGFAYLTRHDIG